MEPAGAHDDLLRQGFSLERDILLILRLKCGKLAGRCDACFFEDDAERIAFRGVADAAHAVHA